jgi:hypothetical protein
MGALGQPLGQLEGPAWVSDVLSGATAAELDAINDFSVAIVAS